MAEISREEAIKRLAAHHNCETKRNNENNEVPTECSMLLCNDCSFNWKISEDIEAIEKAVSDMKKLDKIEKFVNACVMLELDRGILFETAMIVFRIELILEGEI